MTNWERIGRWTLARVGLMFAFTMIFACSVSFSLAGPPDASSPGLAELPDLENVAPVEAPEPAWTTTAKLVSVYDGDTVTVEIARRFRVRIVDCWAPELDDPDPAVREAARASRDNLQAMAKAAGNRLVVSVPLVASKSDGYFDPGKSTTLTRIAGKVWLKNDKYPVNERQIAGGFATRVKPKKS